MIQGEWFIADDLDVPNQFFEEYLWNEEVDHNWHEFRSVEQTNEPADKQEDIKEFLENLISKKYGVLFP